MDNQQLVRTGSSESQCLAPMNTNAVIEQVTAIQTLMKAVMHDGEHYGVIPGCGDKPALLKPGAEKLCFTFRLAAEPDVVERDMPNGHREFTVRCSLRSLSSGQIVGVGVGSASTMESKWRYRSENTGKKVPQSYWDTRDVALLGGSQFSTRKIKNEWYIYHKVEHDNPADYYNTCLKMAKKRALVDATLTALAASDIFTQDVEEMKDLIAPEVVEHEPVRERKQEKPTKDKEAGELSGHEMRGHNTAAPSATHLEKGKIEATFTKKTSTGKPHYGVKIGENWFTTFDSGIFPAGGDLAAVKGCMAVVDYSFDATGKYRNINTMVIVPREPGDDDPNEGAN